MKEYEKQHLNYKTKFEDTFFELEFRLSLFYEPFTTNGIYYRDFDGQPWSNRKIEYRDESTIPELCRWIFDYLIAYEQLENYLSVFVNYETKFYSTFKALENLNPLLNGDKFRKLRKKKPNLFKQLIDEPELINDKMYSILSPSIKDEIKDQLDYKQYFTYVISNFHDDFYFDKLMNLHFIYPSEFSDVKSQLIPSLIQLKDKFEGNQELLTAFMNSIIEHEIIEHEVDCFDEEEKNLKQYMYEEKIKKQYFFADRSGKAYELFHEFLSLSRENSKSGHFNAADVGFIIYVLKYNGKYLPKSFNHNALSKFMQVYCQKVKNELLKFTKDSIRDRKNYKQYELFETLRPKYKDHLDLPTLYI